MNTETMFTSEILSVLVIDVRGMMMCDRINVLMVLLFVFNGGKSLYLRSCHAPQVQIQSWPKPEPNGFRAHGTSSREELSVSSHEPENLSALECSQKPGRIGNPRTDMAGLGVMQIPTLRLWIYKHKC